MHIDMRGHSRMHIAMRGHSRMHIDMRGHSRMHIAMRGHLHSEQGRTRRLPPESRACAFSRSSSLTTLERCAAGAGVSAGQCDG